MHEDLPIVVVGGGIAGITAALTLSEGGLPVLLLEKNPRSLGGRVAAYPATHFVHQGRSFTFSVEHGMHGWWRQYRNFWALLERQGLSARMIAAYDQALLFDDGKAVYRTNVGRETQVTRVPEPFHHVRLLAKENLRRLIRTDELPLLANLATKVLEAICFDPYDAKHREKYDALSVADYLRGVPFFFQAFLRSLTRSGFFSDPQHVSLWAFLLSLQLYVFLRREDQCFSFPRGPVVPTLLEPLAARIAARGGRLVRGVSVERVERAPGGGWTLAWKRTGADAPTVHGDPAPELGGYSGTLRARAVVLAVDVEGAKALRQRSPDLVAPLGDLSAFRGRPSTVVRLFFGAAPSLEYGESGVFSGRATVDNFFWLHRFQDEFAAFHAETGGSVLEGHIYAPERLHALPDAELFARVERDVERAFPEVAGSCLHRTIVRNEATHINFPVGSARSFPKVVTAQPDLVLCGDWIDGGAPVLYMERACQTALVAANALLARAGLPETEVLFPSPPPAHLRAFQKALRRVDRHLPGLWPTRPRRGSAAEAAEEDER